MPTAKKIKILYQLFRFMNKIAAQKNKDFREFLKPLYDKTSLLAKESEDVIAVVNRRNFRKDIEKITDYDQQSN